MSFLSFLCHAGMPVVNGDSMISAISCLYVYIATLAFK